MALFFECVNIEARARDEGVIPDLETYIDVRRDTSGTSSTFTVHTSMGFNAFFRSFRVQALLGTY